MRKKIFWVLVLTLLFPAVTAQASDVTLTVVNSTGFTVLHVYVSPAKAGAWGSDMLGNAVLEDGESLAVRVRNGARYDIRLVDVDGDTYTKVNWGSTTGSGNWRATFTPKDID